MKHASSRELFAYWDALRGTRTAPDRAEIEPGEIRKVLGDTFILAFDPDAGHPVRLAGTRVCALFGRELKGAAFAELWDAASRPAIRDLIDVAADEGVGLVAGASGRTPEGYPHDLELLLLPLRQRGDRHARLIGTLAPVTVPFWLGASRLASLTLGTTRHVGAMVETVAAPRLVDLPSIVPARRGFVVYEGGRDRGPNNPAERTGH